MKRLIWVVLGLILAAGVAGLATGVSVEPNGSPAPGLPPSSWACYPTCVLPTDIVAADFNQDGWVDLAVSCAGTGNVFYYQSLTLPRGAFALATTPPGTVEIPNAFPNAQYLVAGHIRRYDGFPDLAIVHSANVSGPLANITVAPNAGAPFGATAPLALGGGTIIDIAGGNFTNNNVMDFAYLTSARLRVWGWNGVTYIDLGGGPLPMPNGEAPIALAIGDFDQNGWADVAVVTNGPNLYVFFDARGGAFGASLGPVAVNIPVPTAIDVGDFDADGFPDIVVVGNRPTVPDNGHPSGLAQAFINQVHQVLPTVAAGNFLALPAMRTWGFNARAVEAFDADGNGRDDFAVANWGSKTVTVFLADATPLIGDTRDTRGDTPPSGPCLNPQGMNPDRLQVWFQQFKIELQCGYYPTALASGDFDRNGKMDLAVALQSADEELCAQNNSCIEIDYDIACGFVAGVNGVAGQVAHSALAVDPNESQTCETCKDCGGNTPPKPEIQTGSDSKN